MKYSADPTAARKEPMTKVMPISCAVSKSREAARMAMPILVWLMSWVSTTTSATTRNGVITVTILVEVPAMVI